MHSATRLKKFVSKNLTDFLQFPFSSVLIIICVSNFAVVSALDLSESSENALSGWKYDQGQGRGQGVNQNAVQGHVDIDINGDDGNLMENSVAKFRPPEADSATALTKYYEQLDQDEEECPEGFWWHLRGQRCVPTTCFGGNKLRDPGTGECIRKSGRKYNKGLLNYFSRISSHRRFIPVLKHFRGRRIYG